MDAAIIDAGTFAELQESAGAEFVAELLGTFFEEAPGMLAELRSARAAGDPVRFKRAAHSLKSNSQTFGARQLAGLARSLEMAGLDADPARDALALDALEATYAQVASSLKAVRHG